MPETSTPTLTPDATTKVPAFQNNNPGNVELGALKSFILNQAGLANGLATLDADGKLDAAQIPANLDDVLVYGSYALLPAVGESGKLYITTDVNGSYYWNGTSYQMLNNSFVRYRGTVSALPSNPQAGDWFIAASTFTEGGVTYTSGAIYLYNGSSWDDATAVFGQFVRKSDISQTIGPEIDKVPSNAAVNGAINAINEYTTTEKEIGSYDGVKLYRKTFIFSLSSSEQRNFYTVIGINASKIRKMDAYKVVSGDAGYALPFYLNDSDYCQIYFENTTIYILRPFSGECTVYVTIEYIK